MLPESALPVDVLPTDQLAANGRSRCRAPRRAAPHPEPAQRGQRPQRLRPVVRPHRRSPSGIDHPIVWVAAFVLMGRAFALFAILGHEAAHRLLFSRRRWNDMVGRWLLSYPAFVPFDLYRRSHFAHHRDEMGPDEPDLGLYQGYPIPRDSMRRKLTRDAVGISGWKNLKGLLLALRSARGPTGGPAHPRRPGGRCSPGSPLVGRPELVPVPLAGPVDDRLAGHQPAAGHRRARRHDPLRGPAARPPTTSASRWLARFWIVPFNTGWHLAHHVDMGVPFQQPAPPPRRAGRRRLDRARARVPELPDAVARLASGAPAPTAPT